MDDDDRNLVEPEGVNAGSDAAVADDRRRSGEVRGGGSPQRSDEPEPSGSPTLLGPPRQDPGTPGQELSAGEG